MPYNIVPVGNDQFSVINTKSGRIHSYHTSYENAQAQVKLLNGVMRGFIPTHTKIPRLIGQDATYLHKRNRHESVMTR
jgi:hypothetical protein